MEITTPTIAPTIAIITPPIVETQKLSYFQERISQIGISPKGAEKHGLSEIDTGVFITYRDNKGKPISYKKTYRRRCDKDELITRMFLRR